MKVGKTQAFSRECNTELVLNLLRKKDYSGTELADTLSLSNATVSSIIKELSEMEVIRISETTSINGLGRKRVNFEINPNYGLILAVNISNLHASVSVINMKQDILANSDIKINKYDTSSFYQIILEATKLLMNGDYKKIPLRCIVISLPGRVNSITGELMLASQFDKELFSEKNFIQNSFRKQFPNVPILFGNDINIMTIGELNNGALKNVRNGLYLSIDYGIGGGIVINNQLYTGDLGYAGEFGLVKYYDGERFEAVDEKISLRALCDRASEIVGHKVDRDELVELYRSNDEIHDLVIKTSKIVGYVIAQLSDILDISKIIISGRVTNFGEDYLVAIKNSIAPLVNVPDVSFSVIGKDAEVYGSSSMAMDYIFNQIKTRID